MINNNIKNNKGIILSSVLVFTMIAIPLIIALTAWFGTTLKGIRTLVQKEQSFHIAEAGIDFYKWHLDKDQDYLLGVSPLVREFYDSEGNLVGDFSINIYKESDILVAESTGSVNGQPDSSRTIRVKFSRPSYLEYAFISDSASYFREGSEVFGRVHSNGGIRFEKPPIPRNQKLYFNGFKNEYCLSCFGERVSSLGFFTKRGERITY
jgi:hypothetical protein